MTKWFEQYKNVVLIFILVLFLLLFLFYSFFIRPLAAEEKTNREELNRIEEDVSFYQQKLADLKPQNFTEEEKQLLVGSIPAQPNVEGIIRDLEKTEVETGIVIESAGFKLYPNEINIEQPQEQSEASEPAAETDSETIETEQENSPEPEGPSSWEHIFPLEIFDLIKDKLTGITDITVSFVEITIDLNGNVEDVNQFIDQLEHLPRIIHVQSYDYSINEEQDNRAEGILTIRAFYSDNFVEFVEDETEFALDYEFSPDNINRYLDLTNPENINPENGSGENESTEQIDPAVPFEPTNPTTPNPNGSSSNSETNQNNVEPGSIQEFNPIAFYSNSVAAPREGAPEFYVVQTGAYTNSGSFLYAAITRLVQADIYPRVVEDRLSYVFTASNFNQKYVKNIADDLSRQGFNSYVKKLPIRLTSKEQELLLPAANAVISSLTGLLSNGQAIEDFMLTEDMLTAVQMKVVDYENQVQLVLNSSDNENRKQELRQTVAILRQVEEVLDQKLNTGVTNSFAKAESLVLDFMLIFNGYIPFDSK